MSPAQFENRSSFLNERNRNTTFKNSQNRESHDGPSECVIVSDESDNNVMGKKLCHMTVVEVSNFVKKESSERFGPIFAAHEIDGKALCLLDIYHFCDIIKMPLGMAIKLLAKIQELKRKDERKIYGV